MSDSESESEVQSLEMPPPLRGQEGAETSFLPKILSLNFPSELDNIMSTPDNVVVCFLKPSCPYCMEFMPVYDSIAQNIHRTNLNGGVPIVVASIDAAKWKDAINKMRPGFIGDPVNQRGYPTLLFKRGDGVAVTWDPQTPRSEAGICALMSEFYGDSSLTPLADKLEETMNNPDPDFLYFFSDNVMTVPRFVNGLDPSFVNVEDAVSALNCIFITNPELASRGAAIPVNTLDRPDLKIPSIYDRRQKKEYAYRDAHRYILDLLQPQEAT